MQNQQTAERIKKADGHISTLMGQWELEGLGWFSNNDTTKDQKEGSQVFSACEHRFPDFRLTEGSRLVSSGFMLRRKLPSSFFGPCRVPSAFTLVELLVAIALVLILASVLVPIARTAIRKANATKCLSNLNQISVASSAYSSDSNGAWPPGRDGVVFADYLIPYLGNIPGRTGNFMNSPLICPSARTSNPDSKFFYKGIYTPSSYVDSTGKTISYGLSYGQNVTANEKEASAAYRVGNRVAAERPTGMMLYMDYVNHYRASPEIFSDSNRMTLLKERHDGLVNVAFADGSVRAVPWDVIPVNMLTPNGFWQGRGNQ
ncbi:MAG TPA: prepilin-type N-terminal cleavage/methylation domain-containing protein [Terrimicrobiaceae bacterium]|nr:prepilin-type N-terminal cleavage/methylation domain-containing protein [Terrimicrobiaceae bacterium]